MDRHRKELLVARVCSGCVRLRLARRGGGEETYLVRRPTREEWYAASEVYFDVLRESELEGLYSDEELLSFLLEKEAWDEPRQKLLDSLPREIEEFKLKLFQASFKANERKVIRKALSVARAKLAEVSEQRSVWSYLSCSGAAALAKARYVMGCSLWSASGRVFAGSDHFWESQSGLLDEAMAAYARCRLDEGEYRELARTDPWRSLWNANRVERSVFGVPPADYTEEQVSLVNWSNLYDSIYQHPECPPDSVVEDDDLLDGWMIDQRRKREKRLAEGEGEGLVQSEKIRNSDEVYLVAETAEDARKVVDLNDEFGKAIQKRRFGHLKDKGEVNELDMPDTRQRLRMEMVQLTSRAMKGQKQG